MKGAPDCSDEIIASTGLRIFALCGRLFINTFEGTTRRYPVHTIIHHAVVIIPILAPSLPFDRFLEAGDPSVSSGSAIAATQYPFSVSH